MRKALKVDDKFTPGSRNTTLYSYARFFQDMGFTDNEVVDVTLWINGGQLDEAEINNTIFRSLKINYKG
jgi:hypothetical protein